MKNKTLKENGQLRGQEILQKYGPEHFAEMGRKSIAKQKKEFGENMFSDRGKKGAATRKAKDPKYLDKMRAKRWGKKQPTDVMDMLLGKSR